MNILRLLQERAKDYDCSVCGTNHAKSQISVIGKRDDAYVVRVVCSKCETKIILHVYVGDRATSVARPAPARRAQRPPISLDEVIDAHELLEAFEGAPSDLFSPSGKVRSSTDNS